MTFDQQVLASFLGTTFGFIFSIILFLITWVIKTYLERKTLRKHLKREFEYDISLLQEWIDEIDKILRKITANDHGVFSILRYSFFQRTFMQAAFHSGLMYNSLNNEQISNLNNILVHCDAGIEQYINSFILEWKSSRKSQQETLGQFEFEKEELRKYQKHLRETLVILNQ